jgi:hypothetical protein
MDEVWYRYEDSGEHIYLHTYPVISHTLKGVWLRTGAEWTLGKEVHLDRKFVLKKARKHWACPTKEEAWISFRRRKVTQVSILTNQLDRAQAALRIAFENTLPPQAPVKFYDCGHLPLEDYA